MNYNFRTLNADEIDIRVGNVITTPSSGDGKGKCTLLLYVQARACMAILDETVGCTNWKREHFRDNQNCTVSIWDDDKKQWVGKEDTGTESNTEQEKGLASDSFKRSCINWGIARELYSAKDANIIVECDMKDNRGKYKPKGGISWEVKKIEYNEDKREIDHIEIDEVYYGKRKTVFAWNRNRKTTLPKEEEPTEKEPEQTNPTVDKEEGKRFYDNICEKYKIKDKVGMAQWICEQLDIASVDEMDKDQKESLVAMLEKRGKKQ